MGANGGEPVVLLSGGVDSAVVLALLKRAGRAPAALWIDYGQPAATAELRASEALAGLYDAAWSRVDVHGLAPPAAGEFPGRNDLLVATAGVFGGGAPVAIGVHAGTGYADCSPGWLHGWQAHLATQRPGEATLLAPLIDASKADVLALARELAVPTDLAYSCETSSEPCARCSSCMDRARCDARP
ncbi:7-cyano-7-deazaguanine synthase [uncultured Modestobacter sp.]|uniref:7-cyano-7-deazaguanine synthase n=1 Tax=uncultured Modestobacter sp. TaxID=380048 RepID=UPI0034212CE5